jgi:hypothetical protein
LSVLTMMSPRKVSADIMPGPRPRGANRPQIVGASR